MNRSISLHPLSLVLGIAFASICFISMSQVGVSRDCWGPPKKDIVNVYQEPGSATIPPGGTFVAYDVPTDRWMTVTGVSATGNGLVGARWSEEINGVITPKGRMDVSSSSIQGSGGAVGLTFRPGSRVIMENVSGSMSIQLFTYSVIGYLSRE